MKVSSMLYLTGESSEEYFIALVQCVFKMEIVTTRRYVCFSIDEIGIYKKIS